jgi:hypothetical protein
MKTLYAIVTVALLGASLTAMADDGSDRVDAQMNAARIVAMRHYDATHDASQVAKHDAGDQHGAPETSKQQG